MTQKTFEHEQNERDHCIEKCNFAPSHVTCKSRCKHINDYNSNESENVCQGVHLHTFLLVACNEHQHRIVGYDHHCVSDNSREDIGDVHIHDLPAGAKALRNIEYKDQAQHKWYDAYQKPWSCLADFRIGLVNDCTHCYIRYTIEESCQQHHRTDNSCAYTHTVCIVQGCK